MTATKGRIDLLTGGERYKEAYGKFLDLNELSDNEESAYWFNSHFLEAYETKRDFAVEFYQTYLPDVPNFLMPYIDFSAMANDLFKAKGSYQYAEADDGTCIYVWRRPGARAKGLFQRGTGL